MTLRKNGEPERQFEAAVAEKKIKFVSQDEIKAALRYAMIKIGLRASNFPKDEEKALLIHHIIEHYGNHTCGEIRLAFDLAITGRLGIEANCYENFSCLFFSSIMGAYRKWAAAEWEVLKNKQAEDEEIKIYTDEENDEKLRELVNINYRSFLIGNTEYINPFIKDILIKDGLMKEDEKIENFFSKLKNKGIKNVYVKE